VEVAADLEVPHGDDDEQPVLEFGADGPTADEGDAPAGDRRLLGRLHEAHLGGDVELLGTHAGGLEVVLDDGADAGALLLHDLWFGDELGEGDVVARRPGVRRAADEDDLVAHKRLDGQVGTVGRCADGADLELARDDTLDHLVGVVDVERDAHARVELAEARQQAGQDMFARPRRRAHHDVPGDELAEVEDLGAGALVEGEDLACVAVEHLAGVRRGDAPVRAVEKGGLELALKGVDLLACGRLRDAHVLSGEREAVPFDDTAEEPQLTDIHASSLSQPCQRRAGGRGVDLVRRAVSGTARS